MSSVVGNVSIELQVDRSEYDKAIDRLKKEQPSAIMVKTSLDTSGLSKQLEAFKSLNIQLVASLDTKESDRQLADFLKPRSVKVAVDLDTKAFEAKLRNLAIGDINVKAKLDTSDLVQSLRKLTAPDIQVSVAIDTANATNKITEFTKTRSMLIRVDIDNSALMKSFKMPSVKLTAIVDDSALTKLNEHLSLKERHFKQVQSLFSGSPLTPKVDDRALTDLNKSISSVKSNFEELNRFLGTSMTATINTRSAKQSISDLLSSVRLASANVRVGLDVDYTELDKFSSRLNGLSRNAAVQATSSTSQQLRVYSTLDTSGLNQSFEKFNESVKSLSSAVGIFSNIQSKKGGLMSVITAPITTALKLPGKIINTALTGMIEQIGANFGEGIGLTTKSINAGKTAKMVTKSLNTYLLDVEEMTAAFLAEGIRTGSPMGAVKAAVNASKGKVVASQLAATMTAPDQLDPSKVGKAQAKQNRDVLMSSLSKSETVDMARKYLEGNEQLMHGLIRVTGSSRDQILNDPSIGQSQSVKSYVQSQSNVAKPNPKYLTKDESRALAQKKSQDDEMKLFSSGSNSKESLINISKKTLGLSAPIVTLAAQRQAPKEFIQEFVNPALKEFSKLTDFIGKIQTHRTISEASSIKSQILPNFPGLRKGEKGYVQMIGGAQFAEGEGHRKLTAWGHGLFPEHRVLGVANPDLDPGAKPSPGVEKAFSLFSKFAPAVAENKELKNTVVNALTMLISSLNPAGYSKTVASGMANMMAAKEKGADMSQFATTTYSLGGYAGRQLSEMQGRAGFDTKVHSLAFPDLNPAQRTTPNYTASVIEADALAGPKVVLGLGGSQNIKNYSTGTMPGAAAHGPQHYFKNSKQVDDYYKSLGIQNPGSSKTSEFITTGQNFYEMLGASEQVRNMSTSKDHTFNSKIPMKAFSSGDNAIDNGAQLISKYVESLNKLTGGTIDSVINDKNASSVQRAIAAKTKEHILSTLKPFTAFLNKQGFNLSETATPQDVVGQIGGVSDYNSNYQSFNAVKRSFQTGKVSEGDKEHAWFAGDMDPSKIKLRLGDGPLEGTRGAIAHFSKPDNVPSPEIRGKLVSGFSGIRTMGEEFIKNGSVSKETIDSIPDYKEIPISPILQKVFSTKFSSKNSPGIESMPIGKDQSMLDHLLDYRQLADTFESQKPEAVKKRVATELPLFQSNLSKTWEDNTEYHPSTITSFLDKSLPKNALANGGSTLDHSWESTEEKAKRVANERIARKLEQSKNRREKISEGVGKARSIGNAVKDAVFNPDREVTIDMDKVTAAAQTTGKVLHAGGLAIAKTMDAINVGFNILAQSNPGQKVLGATKEASTALLHVAKTGYGLAKGVEDATLSIIPFGKTAKAGIQNIGLPMLAANVAASHIPGGQMLLEGAGNVANMALGPLAHGGVSAMAQGAGSAIGGIFPQFGGMGAHVASGVSGLIEGGLGGAIAPAIEGAVTLITGKLMMNTAGSAVAKLPGVAEITGAKAIMPSSTRSLPQAKTLALSATDPQLQDLTDKQLRAYAKTKGLAFGSKAKKEDVINRLEQTTLGDLSGLATTIGSQFNHKGQAIKTDTKSEASMIAQFRQQEKRNYALNTQIKAAVGHDRAMMVEQLLHESTVFADQLKSANTQPMSGKSSQAIGQMLGRANQFAQKSEGNLEARGNRSAGINETLNNPLNIQTIETQAQRLYRVADEKQLNIFQKIRSLLSKRSNGVAELNFKALYAEIAVSNKLTDLDSNIPTLAIGKENSYDPNSNTVSVTKRAYRELSKPIGKLRPNEIKPVTHEIQHSQQLDGGNRSISEAAYGSDSYRFGLMDSPLPKRIQRQVDASVLKSSNPQNADAVKKLEIDAYNKETRTKEFLNSIKASSGTKMPLNAIGLKLTDHVGHAIDEVKGEMPAINLESTQNENPVAKYAAKIQKTIKGINNDISNKLNKQISNVTLDAKSLITDIEVSRTQALQRGDTAQAKELGSFKNRVEKAVTKSDSINSKDKRADVDNTALKALRSEYREIYAIADRPIPFKLEGGFLDKIGGASKAIKGFALGLIALPFATQAAMQGFEYLKQFAAQALQASIAADRVKTSLEFSTGSKSGGDSAYQFADNTATKMGIDRNSAIEGYSKIRASSKGKISEGQVNDLYSGVAAASTTLGLSGEDQNGVMLALGKMLSTGTVNAEQLRGEIGERLPGAFAVAARSMGVTEQQLNKMMETGSLTADMFLTKLGPQLNREFGGGAEKASQNLQSSLFRIQGAMAHISEGAGTAAAPAMQGFANIAVEGLDLIAKYGEKVSSIFSVLMLNAIVKVSSAAIGFISPMVAQFLAYQGIAATIPGVLGAIGGSLANLIPLVATFAAKFILVNAGIEVAKTLFAAFTPSDMASQFTTQADKINQSLKEIEVNGKKASGALPSDSNAPSKGLDINAATFGVAGAVGVGRGDDAVKALNKAPAWVGSMIAAVPILGPTITAAKIINERNGGKGFATKQEADYNSDAIALSEQGDANRHLAGHVDSDRGQFTQSLQTAESEQKVVDAKQAEKSRLLSGGATNKDAVANVDKQIAESAAKRDEAAKPFTAYRDQIQNSITALKTQKELIAKSGDYSGDQKKDLTGKIDAQLGAVESVKKELDALDKKFNGSGDIISKFNVALSEMAAKIEEVSAKAENAFNKAEVSRLTDKKAGRQTDEFASTNNAERQAGNEKNMADNKLSGTQKAIADVDKIMQDPTVKRDLAKITVNGKSIDAETSAAELNQAKIGKTEGEKTKIDKLVDRRKAIDSVPGLKKTQLESDEKLTEAKQSNVLEKSDRKFKNREIQFKEFEGKANIGLINAQKGNKVGESDVAIRSAEIQNISAKEAKSSVKDKITEIDKLYKAGKISREEFTKRSIDLRGQLVDANVKAAQAELAVEQAKNKKILQDWEITIKKRELADKTTRTEKMISLTKAQSGNRMSDDDVNVSKSEIDLESANKGSANIATQISELENLKNRGIISHEEYVKRKLDLDSNYLDAKARQAEAELALEKAKNQKIVAEFDRVVRIKTFMADEGQGNAENEIKRSALSGKVFGSGGEKEAREQKIATSRKKLGLIDEKSNGLDTLRSEGTISQKDYESRKMEAVTQYRQENENLLNLEIAKRLGLYQAEADAFKRTTNEVVLGLEKQRSAFEISKSTMASKQGVLEAGLGYAKATQSSDELKLSLQGEGLADSRGNVIRGVESEGAKKQFSKKIDQFRVDSLVQVQAIELQILEIKEQQQRVTLKQAEIESTISIAKQKIAVNEAKKKLKDAKLTGDVDAIANAQDDLAGQNQILGLENNKKNALKEQNDLAEKRLGIERKTVEVGMASERLKVRADQVRNQRAAQVPVGGSIGGSSGIGGSGGSNAPNDGVYRNIDPVTGNMVIGGGSFLTGEGIQQNKIGGVTPENLGEVSKSVDLASRVDPKKGGGNTTVSYDASNEKSSNKIVNAIDKLGGQLKDNGTKSGDKTVSGDYSSIINGLVDSKNSRN